VLIALFQRDGLFVTPHRIANPQRRNTVASTRDPRANPDGDGSTLGDFEKVVGVADVLGLGGVDGVFANIFGVVTDPFEMARHEK
jgi:hypothetical protein